MEHDSNDGGTERENCVRGSYGGDWCLMMTEDGDGNDIYHNGVRVIIVIKMR